MFNKKNPMRYFSGSTFVRLPLYKLAAGGTAVALTASHSASQDLPTLGEPARMCRP